MTSGNSLNGNSKLIFKTKIGMILTRKAKAKTTMFERTEISLLLINMRKSILFIHTAYVE